METLKTSNRVYLFTFPLGERLRCSVHVQTVNLQSKLTTMNSSTMIYSTVLLPYKQKARTTVKATAIISM